MMGYKAFISVGKTKTASIELPTKERLANYVKRSPVGNANTKIEVFDISTGKTLYGSKRHFSNVRFW